MVMSLLGPAERVIVRKLVTVAHEMLMENESRVVVPRSIATAAAASTACPHHSDGSPIHEIGLQR